MKKVSPNNKSTIKNNLDNQKNIRRDERIRKTKITQPHPVKKPIPKNKPKTLPIISNKKRVLPKNIKLEENIIQTPLPIKPKLISPLLPQNEQKANYKTMEFFNQIENLIGDYEKYKGWADVANLYMEQVAKQFDYVCIPYYKESDKYAVPSYITYVRSRREIILGPGVNQAIKDCLLDRKIKFICIYLRLDFSEYEKNQNEWVRTKRNPGHANMIIIETESKIVERFEPHSPEVITDIDEDLFKEFEKYGLKYIGPMEFCPFGFQAVQKRQRTNAEKELYGGYCVAWSLFYFHVRILNPSLSRDEVIKKCLEIVNNTKKSRPFFYFIRQYSLGLIKIIEDLDPDFAAIYGYHTFQSPHKEKQISKEEPQKNILKKNQEMKINRQKDYDNTMKIFKETLDLTGEYQKYHNDIDILLLYMKRLSEIYTYVCVPFYDETDKNKIINYIKLTFYMRKYGTEESVSRRTLRITQPIYDAMDKCFMDETKNFICILLIIEISYFKPRTEEIQKTERYSNMVIIDTKNKTLEVFNSNKLPEEVNNIIDEIIPHWFEKYPDGRKTHYNLKYIGRVEFCPLILQSKQKEFYDYCGAWTIFYFHVRILNPSLNKDEVIKLCLELVNNTGKDNKFLHFIQQYSLQMIDLLKDLDTQFLKQRANANIEPLGHFSFQKESSYCSVM